MFITHYYMLEWYRYASVYQVACMVSRVPTTAVDVATSQTGILQNGNMGIPDASHYRTPMKKLNKRAKMMSGTSKAQADSLSCCLT